MARRPSLILPTPSSLREQSVPYNIDDKSQTQGKTCAGEMVKCIRASYALFNE